MLHNWSPLFFCNTKRTNPLPGGEPVKIIYLLSDFFYPLQHWIHKDLFVGLNALFHFVRLNALKTFSPVHLLFQLTKLKKTSFLSEKGLKTPLYKGVLLIEKGWSWFSWENEIYAIKRTELIFLGKWIYAIKRMELIFLGKWNICDKKDGADFLGKMKYMR